MERRRVADELRIVYLKESEKALTPPPSQENLQIEGKQGHVKIKKVLKKSADLEWDIET